MTIMIFGCDGYIGWNLMVRLGVKRDEKIVGVDNMARRAWVDEVKSDSLTPIKNMDERIKAYKEVFGRDNLHFIKGDLCDTKFVYDIIRTYRPHTIINLAQMPSAPYSMRDIDHALYTQQNNVENNLIILWAIKDIDPSIHYIRLGTMGEYGTPNIDIPEGFFEIEYRGRKDVLPFPKQAGSWYHWTKVDDSNKTMFACKVWGLRATDLMQGVVYGVTTDETEKDERLLSRFDYDGDFGTAINRFVVQALCGEPLTPYGKGGQIRGFINIKDSLSCFELYIDNPPKKGEYRVFNQLTDDGYTIYQLAKKVAQTASNFALNARIEPITNPRLEMEEHYYNPDHSKIYELGLKPHNMDEEIEKMFKDLLPYKHRIKKETIKPRVKWY